MHYIFRTECLRCESFALLLLAWWSPRLDSYIIMEYTTAVPVCRIKKCMRIR